ncbi:tyrosine-type recombinase/integrase [Bradyrhizobium cenepequi]
MKQKPLRLKGVHRVKWKRADGSIVTYLYHRASGTKLDPDHLVESYAAAEKKMRTKGDGTFVQLIRLWDTNNPVFDALSEETRESYPWRLKKIEAKWGRCPIATFNDPDDADAFAGDALEWHLELGRSSLRSADNLMSALCRVLSFAKEKRKIKHHPIPTFTRLYKSDRSDQTWSEELQQQFIATARPAMATAMYLVRNTAMRAGAIRKFPWSRYDGKRVQIWSTKNKKWLWIPATIELKAHLDGLERKGPLVLVTPTGKAYAKRYFNEHWREDADKVNAGELNFHDNRGTAATLLAEAGATAPEIAEALTWTVDRAQKMLDTYLARRGTLAANAYEKLEAHRIKQAAAGMPDGDSARPPGNVSRT